MKVAVSSDAISDLEVLLDNLGLPNDPEIVERVERRADVIRERILRETGPLDIAVDLIQEVR